MTSLTLREEVKREPRSCLSWPNYRSELQEKTGHLGALAHSGEHCDGIAEVRGAKPLRSTNSVQSLSLEEAVEVPSAQRVAHPYLVRLACQEAHRSASRVARRSVPREVFAAMVEAFLDPEALTITAGFGSILKKVQQFLALLQRAPSLVPKLKGLLGEMTPGNLTKWAKEGKDALVKTFAKASREFPLGILFHPKVKAPTLTSLLTKILKETKVGRFLEERVKPGAKYIDDLFKEHLPTLRRPLYAAIFIYIWFSVAEISWDVAGILDGFLGNVSLTDLMVSLPESALGAILASIGLSFHLLPVMMVARLVWLVAQNYIEWDGSSGSFKVHWNLLGAYEPA